MMERLRKKLDSIVVIRFQLHAVAGFKFWYCVYIRFVGRVRRNITVQGIDGSMFKVLSR